MTIAADTSGSPTRLQGRYGGMVVCWILGLGCLVLWNSMLTIGDYYYDQFPLGSATSGKGDIGNYTGICIIVATLGVADGRVQGGMVGDLSFMCPTFIQSFQAGLATSGALTSALRLMTKQPLKELIMVITNLLGVTAMHIIES